MIKNANKIHVEGQKLNGRIIRFQIISYEIIVAYIYYAPITGSHRTRAVTFIADTSSRGGLTSYTEVSIYVYTYVNANISERGAHRSVYVTNYIDTGVGNFQK